MTDKFLSMRLSNIEVGTGERWVSSDRRHVVLNSAFELADLPQHKIQHAIVDYPAVHDEMGPVELVAWFRASFAALDRALAKDASLILVHRNRKGQRYAKATFANYCAAQGGWRLWRDLCWLKTDADFNRSAPAFTLISAFVRGSMASRDDSPIRYKDILKHKQDKTPPSEWVGVEPMPKSLYTSLLTLFVKQDDIVLDPYAGSGTCAQACVAAQIRSVSVELNQHQFDVVIKNVSEAIDNAS